MPHSDWSPRTLLVPLLAPLLVLLAGCCPKGSPKTAADSPACPRAGRARAPASLEEGLKSPSPSVRAESVRRLARNPAPKAVEWAVALLGDPYPDVVAAAGDLLKRRPNEAIPALVAALRKEESPCLLERLARLLQEIGEPAIGALIGALEGAGPPGPERAAEVLRRLGAPVVVPLAKVMVKSKAPAVRLLAVRVLRLLGGDKVRAVFLRVLHHLDYDTLEAVVEALRDRRDPDSMNRYLEALKQGFWRKAVAMVSVLHDSKDPRVQAAIVELFARMPSTNARHLLLTEILRHGTSWYETLATALVRAPSGNAAPSAELRRSLVLALAYAAVTTDRLRLAAEQHGRDRLALWARMELMVMGRAFGQPEVVRRLQEVMNGPDPEATRAAAQWLAVLSGQGDLKARVDLKGVEKRYESALKEMAQKAQKARDVERHLWTLTRLGDLAWERSCKVPQVHGLCQTTRQERVKGQKRTRQVVVFVPREAKQVEAARRYFEQARQIWNRGKAIDSVAANDPRRLERTRRIRHYAAWATFMNAEVKLEANLGYALPAKANMSSKRREAIEASRRALSEWVEERMRQGQDLANKYRLVTAEITTREAGQNMLSAYWTVASLARIGLAFESFGWAIRSLPVPVTIAKDIALVSAYRNQLAKDAKPFLDKAAELYELSLRAAYQGTWYWDWAIDVEYRLFDIDSDRFLRLQERQKVRLTRAPSPAN